MRLPDLTTTEYIGVFLGTQSDKALKRAKDFILAAGGTELETTGGRQHFALRCNYRENNRPHCAILVLVEMKQKRWGIGLDVTIDTKRRYTPCQLPFGLEASELIRKIRRIPFEKLLSDLDQEFNLNSMSCFVSLSGYLQRLSGPCAEFVQTLFGLKGPVEMSCGTFDLKRENAHLCVQRLEEVSEAEDTRETQADGEPVLYTYMIEVGHWCFGDVFPRLPGIGDLARTR